MKKIIVLVATFCIVSGLLFVLPGKNEVVPVSVSKNVVGHEVTPTVTPTIPVSKILTNDYHVFQTFNNCGPAALSMALSYYDISVSQQELANDIRPNQNPKGISDDKSVTLDELAVKAEEYGLIAYHRPNGSIDLIKQFITNDMPVVARTWLKNGEDIGHYRVIKGYDDSTQSFLQDDSLQGKNLWYNYDEFNVLWEAFNFEYIVLVPSDKIEIAEKILGEDQNEKKSWEKAAETSATKFEKDSSNTYAGFNAAVAYSKIGKHQEAIEWFEKVESRLPRRMLWYQLDPIVSYLALGNFSRVTNLTNAILASENNAHAELYLLQAEVNRRTNHLLQAKNLYQKALLFDKNLLKRQNVVSSESIEELGKL